MEEYTMTFTADITDEARKVIFGLKEMEEKKDPKETCVDAAMDSIDQIISGKHFRAIRGAIEQQIRYAYKKGFEDGKNSVDADNKPLCDAAVFFNHGVHAGFQKGYREGFDKGYDHGVNDTKIDALNTIKEWKETTDGGDKS